MTKSFREVCQFQTIDTSTSIFPTQCSTEYTIYDELVSVKQCYKIVIIIIIM